MSNHELPKIDLSGLAMETHTHEGDDMVFQPFPRGGHFAEKLGGLIKFVLPEDEASADYTPKHMIE